MPLSSSSKCARERFDKANYRHRKGTAPQRSSADLRTRLLVAPRSIWGLGLEGGLAMVRKICLDREIEKQHLRRVRSLKAIPQHCPDLPVPRVFSDTQAGTTAQLIYSIMDWIDGVELWQQIPAFTSGSNIEQIQENLIVQLATFVYNLTTCPIPEIESK